MYEKHMNSYQMYISSSPSIALLLTFMKIPFVDHVFYLLLLLLVMKRTTWNLFPLGLAINWTQFSNNLHLTVMCQKVNYDPGVQVAWACVSWNVNPLDFPHIIPEKVNISAVTIITLFKWPPFSSSSQHVESLLYEKNCLINNPIEYACRTRASVLSSH